MIQPTDEEFLDMYSSEYQEIDVDEVMVDARGVHCTKYVRVYVSAHEGY